MDHGARGQGGQHMGIYRSLHIGWTHGREIIRRAPPPLILRE